MFCFSSIDTWFANVTTFKYFDETSESGCGQGFSDDVFSELSAWYVNGKQEGTHNRKSLTILESTNIPCFVDEMKFPSSTFNT